MSAIACRSARVEVRFIYHLQQSRKIESAIARNSVGSTQIGLRSTYQLH